ncbi:MAG TPA: M20 family metallopeptidase [Acidimicrobiales bacterium]|nr:M20 family metallopeptidase [Acidimicrobiales bacterium]
MDLGDARDRLEHEVERRADLLLDVSHRIHEHPELNFEEHHAHDLLTATLEAAGLDVTRSAHGLDTAFVARAGTEGPTVAVICEYDALPGIGHACGHNVIAAAGLGAGLAAAALADELGGQIVVMGTPAEEGGGGKVLMARDGAFDGVDVALMVHPADHDLAWMTTIAIQRLAVEYHGEEAHAAAYPELGRNALDAAVLGYVNVAALRQHIRPDERVHGIFTAAGDKPNIVPAHTAAEWYVRSPSLSTLEPLKARVLECLRAGSAASGCSMPHHWIDPPYADLVENPVLSARYAEHAARRGRTVRDGATGGGVVGSTDMGNVSHLVPAIHPTIAVAPPGVSIHTPAFTAHAASAAGDAAVIDGAVAMALTVADLWADPGTLDGVRRAFAAATAEPGPSVL